MRKRQKFITLALVVLAILVVAGWYLHRTNIPLLEPRGPIAEKERNLMIFAAILSLFVVIPVFSMAIFIAWKYRESNTKATYSPEFDRSPLFETIWWVLPGILITILSVVAWNSSHALDPYRPLVSNVQPVNVEVVALDWKWLFIYPQLNMASVNLLEIPVNTPINFDITSDAPMNSFWVPQLSGQIYAMPGMSTELHMSASKAGSYNGYSSNISGTGFSGMHFITQATTQATFNSWVAKQDHGSYLLTQSAYNKLAKPSEDNPVSSYAGVERNLYTTIIEKYITPSGNNQSNTGATVMHNNAGGLMYNMSGMSM